jgi:tetratricopeptide (TPR) repeat protein
MMMIERPLTDGTIAVQNLGVQIEAVEIEIRLGHNAVETGAGLAELLALRGLFLGRIVDYVRAKEIAQQLVRSARNDPKAFLARARARVIFHHFNDALADIDCAVRLEFDVEAANSERAAIFQAIGRYDEALTLREEAAKRRDCFETVAALVGIHAECGQIELAERRYAQSHSLYRGVSPFPLALLDFQMGLMWMGNRQFKDAQTSFNRAVRRVPDYAPAQGHLAEVEAELGDFDAAIARLQPLAMSSDDPDYAGQLARILGDVGRTDECRTWRQRAAARFDELVAAHPEAFADHAAEFWLAAGVHPIKALRLAKFNFGIRQTPRACDLLRQAMAAMGGKGTKPMPLAGSAL